MVLTRIFQELLRLFSLDNTKKNLFYSGSHSMCTIWRYRFQDMNLVNGHLSTAPMYMR